MIKKSSRRGSVAASTSLFLIVFGSWQAYYFLHASIPDIPLLYTYIFYIATYIASLAVFSLFVKLGKSSLGEHGFKGPIRPGRCLTLSVSSILLYLLITLAPGLIWGFGSPPFPHTFFYFAFNVLNAILISLTAESIFRGYVFKSLMGKRGFFTSLYASSLMFSLYQTSITTLLGMSTDRLITYLFTDILPLLAAGIFLGFFFYKTGWSLLGPIMFRMGVLLYSFFPPIMATPPWWMKLTFEVMAYACLIIILDAAIKEPRYRRRRYGLES